MLAGLVSCYSPTPNLLVLVRGREYVALRKALTAGVNPNLPANHPPLVLATALRDHSSIALLFRFHANANVYDKLIGTPISVAALNDDLESVELLLKHGAYANGRSANGCPATITSSPGVLRALLRAGASVSASCEDGQSELHYACSVGNLGCVGILLSHGADVNASDRLGNTPLMYVGYPAPHSLARERTRMRIAAVLLRSGAKLALRNKAGQSAIDLAVRSHLPRLVSMLTKAANPSLRF